MMTMTMTYENNAPSDGLLFDTDLLFAVMNSYKTLNFQYKIVYGVAVVKQDITS